MKPDHQTWLQQTANALTGIISNDAKCEECFG